MIAVDTWIGPSLCSPSSRQVFFPEDETVPIDCFTSFYSVSRRIFTAWYLKGIACMRLERWEDAVAAFVRCVQQDMEIGEAWANIG